MTWLINVGRQRRTVPHIAKRAAPCTQVAQNHKGCSTFAETFTNIRTGRFLAHGMQIMLAQHALHIMVTLTAARLDANPFRLAQALLQRDNFYRIARGLGGAGLFFSGVHIGFRFVSVEVMQVRLSGEFR